MKKYFGVASIIVTSTVLLVTMGTGAAYATSGESVPPPDNQPDRTVYVNGPAPTPPEDSRILSNTEDDTTSSMVVEGDDFPVTPAPGETVRVIYTNAVTDVTRAGSCTESITVDTPYKLQNRVFLTGWAMVSSGCGGGASFTLALYQAANFYTSTSVSVPNDGANHGAGISTKICTYGFNTGFFGIGSWGSGGSTWGPTTTLPCQLA
jgi:hypothetical protein